MRIDAKDVALGHEGDQHTGQLRLAMVCYLADGRVESSAFIPLDLDLQYPGA